MSNETRPGQDNLDSPEEKNDPQGKSFDQDERFQGDPNKLYQSYRELEKHKGSLQEQASIAKKAIDTLARDKGVTPEEAKRMLESGTSEPEPKKQPTSTDDRVRELELKIEAKDLKSEESLDDKTLEAVLDIAKATNRSPKDVYKTHFSHLIKEDMSEKAGSEFIPQSGRAIPSDVKPSPNKKYEDAMAKAKEATSQVERERALAEALRYKGLL